MRLIPFMQNQACVTKSNHFLALGYPRRVHWLGKTRHIHGFAGFRLLIWLFCLLFSFSLSAQQPGSLDITFNPEDTGFGLGDGASNDIHAIAIQPDGKILIGGSFTSYNRTSRNGIARINPDGSLDTSFDPGNGTNGLVYSIIVQPDGKIIIVGLFIFYNNISRNYIARLNSDGSLDTSFNIGSGAGGIINAASLQPDEKIIIGGHFTSYNGITRNRIARINPDGSLDTSFDPGAGPNSFIRDIKVLSDGKILIGGNFTTYDGESMNRIARINTNGSLDLTFTPGTGANASISSLKTDEDGKIIIVGGFTSYNENPSNRIARLDQNGVFDTSFDPGSGADSFINSVEILPDGKIMIGGFFRNYSGTTRERIARLHDDGALDTAFDPEDGADDRINIVKAKSDGTMVIGGEFTFYNNQPRNHLALVNETGGLVATFNPNTGANNSVSAVAPHTEGKILIGGNFTSFNGNAVNRIMRIQSDGTIDETFDPGSAADNFVESLLTLPDDKILVAGRFTTFNQVPVNRITRLNGDGSLDNTFDPGTGANSTITTMVRQPDGRVIIGGTFTTYDDIPRNRIARINPNGSLDTTFDPGTGAEGAVNALALLSDGKIIVGGNFTTFDGTSINRLIVLNQDGSPDASFDPGTGAGSSINAIRVQSNGKIIIGGNFTTFNGSSLNRIAKLNPDGSVDPDFDPGTGVNNSINELDLQTNGKIILVGMFDTFNGTPSRRIARIHNDGQIDEEFDPGSGANLGISALLLLPDGNMIIGGGFTNYDEIGRNRIARVFGDPVLPPDAPLALEASAVTFDGFTASWTTVANAESYRIDVSTDDFENFVDGFEDLVVNETSLDITALNENTQYRYRVRAFGPGGTSENSNVIEVTTLFAPPSTPIANEAVDVSFDRFTANWTTVDGANAYLLDVSTDGFDTFLDDFQDKEISDTSIEVSDLDENTGYFYRVRAVGPGGISEYSNDIQVTTSPILSVRPSEGPEFSINVYPNPVKDLLYISMEGYENTSFKVLLFDASGRITAPSKALELHHGTPVRIDTKDLHRGVYILRVVDDFGSVIRHFRIVKVR